MISNCKNLSIYISFFLVLSCRQPSGVERIKELKNYSSGSGMAFSKHKIFLMGDDMSYILIIDTSFNVVDSIQLAPGFARIPKSIKSDIEALSLIPLKKMSSVLLLGSGSVSPTRSKGWLVDVDTKQTTFIDLDPFYKRVQGSGIKELNIEGLTTVPGGMILANRGNKSFPKNYLIFTSSDFWNNQQTADIRIIKLGASTDTASFSGVSGLDYSYQSDRLFLTISTENTYSTQADGAIGKSYLWMIDNISSKKRLTAINPNRIVDLESLDDRFRGHKIESVCVVSENRTEYKLALVADDDRGTSILYILRLNKKE